MTDKELIQDALKDLKKMNIILRGVLRLAESIYINADHSVTSAKRDAGYIIELIAGDPLNVPARSREPDTGR